LDENTANKIPIGSGIRQLVSAMKPEDNLLPIVQGNREFMEKTGRNMTYSEMREM
jgi:hypothetical protein